MSAAPQHTHRHKTLANAEGLTTFHSPRPLVCTCRRSGENVLPHSPSPSLSLSLSPSSCDASACVPAQLFLPCFII